MNHPLKQLHRIQRKQRIRGKINGTSHIPRLSVFRSNKHIRVQIIDDATGKTLVSASDNDVKKNTGKPLEISFEVGKILSERAKKEDISRIVFDRNGYLFHGHVEMIAKAAREGGLKF